MLLLELPPTQLGPDGPRRASTEELGRLLYVRLGPSAGLTAALGRGCSRAGRVPPSFWMWGTAGRLTPFFDTPGPSLPVSVGLWAPLCARGSARFRPCRFLGGSIRADALPLATLGVEFWP